MYENGEGKRDEGTPSPLFEIRLRGYLPAYRSDWFDGMTLTHDGNGNTILRGPVVDQAALHGLLDRIRDLGIQLLSLRSLDDTPAQ